MSELVTALPDYRVEELLSDYEGQIYLWDNVVDEERDIIALYLKNCPVPIGIEKYWFPTGDYASADAWRLNKLIGLSDEDIEERILVILDREGSTGPDIVQEDICERVIAIENILDKY